MYHLDPLTALQISAGATIDRPAAVVRELIDNAIDAGASHIDITVQDGVIHVTDNGDGMSAHDLAHAFLRHTTSKIRHYDDINTITTLGFRGEALASIAAIARVTCISRTATSPHAHELRIAAGTIHDIRSCAGAVGTSMSVERLYYTAPRRRTFWRQPPHELQLITDIVTRYALLFPHIAFRAQLGDTLLHSSGSGSTTQAVAELWHVPVDTHIVSTLPSSDVTVQGVLVTAADAAAPMRRRQILAINQRPLAVRGMLAHILDELLPPQRALYAALVLSITLPRDMIDINLKASKEEVGIRAPSVVARALYHALHPQHTQLVAPMPSGAPFPAYEVLGYHHNYVVAHSADSVAFFNPATIMQYCAITHLDHGAVLVPPYPITASHWRIMAPHQHTLAQYGLRTASDATGQPVITHLPVCANQRPLSQGVNQLVSCLRQGGSVVAAVASMIDATTLLQWLSHHAEPWQSQAHYVIPDSKITNALRPRRPIAEFGESRPPHRPVPPQSR
jgi:DNA mismatch repair protein MutL